MSREGRVLLLVNATVDPARDRDIVAGHYPRKDYLELQRALQAEVIDLGVLDRRTWTRVARRIFGASLAQSLLAWTRRAHYDAVFADRETTGFALAALFKFTRRRPRLVMIGHLLSPRKKQILFRALRLHHQIDGMIVHSSLQERIAERTLGLPTDQVALIPYQTDDRFWAPQETQSKRQICSAGLEYRDYPTLIAAIADLDVDVVIAAASHWSAHRAIDATQALPPHVRVASLDYASLRHLYAESLFVIVPLQDVENQAGITTILEAMSMGKAVIVSHTRGQTDVVRDRRRHSREDPRRSTQPTWAQALGATDSVAQGHTGLYVRPGDPLSLRQAIVFLLEHPEQARIMGENGRRMIVETMGLDDFVARLAPLIRGDSPVDQRQKAMFGREQALS